MKHRRIVSLVLTVSMMLSMCMTGFAVNTSETDAPAICTCETQCTEGTVNSGCPVCGENGADLDSCKGKGITLSEQECTCETQCTESAVNSGCPVCGENCEDLNSCKGEEITPPEQECTCETKCAEGAVNADCPVCSADGANLEACEGAEVVPEPVCDCETLCAEGNAKADCPVCGVEGADLTNCNGQAPKVSVNNTYTVGSADELTNALTQIAAADATEAVIELTANISKASFAGVEGKHITVTSQGAYRYEISLATELLGPITFDNVYATAGVLYCNGQRTIFTENSKLVTTGTIYGGGNKKNVDSTYLVVNGEAEICNATYDYENIVIGGSYKGSVKGDIYVELAGKIAFGNQRTGGHYITGANKETSYGGDHYEGAPLYVGGDVTLIIDTDYTLSANSHNVSGTHGSHVLGDVNIVVKAGKVLGINAQRGDAAKSRIEGNVHIIAGTKEYENTDRICRLAGKWDITGAGEQIMTIAPEFEVGGNVTIDTYENVWGWDKGSTPPSDLPSIVGVHNSKVDGTVTINAHGSHLESIWGASDERVGTSQGTITFKTEVSKDIIINATDIDLQCAEASDANIVGCYIENGTIGGKIEVNVDSGSMYGIWADGEYISSGKIVINITGKPQLLYGVWGEKDRTEKDDSVINIYSCESTIPFIYHATQVNIYDNSDVTIGGQYKPFYEVDNLNIRGESTLHTTDKTATIYKDVVMNNATWHAEGYVYVYETLQSLNSKVYFDNYFAIGYAHRNDASHTGLTVFTSSNDEFVGLNSGYTGRFYGNVDLNNSDLAFMCPVTVSGDWEGGDSLLRLPVVGNNYPSGTIPLKIYGTASEQCEVLIVDANDHEKNALPVVGQNYIVGFAPQGTSTDNPTQGTFMLKNEDALANGLYLKRVNDPENESTNYMWQIAKGIIVTFDKNGGDTEADPQQMTVTSGSTVGTLPTAPTRENYMFSGWNTDANGQGTEFTGATTVTSDITVYAQWKESEEQTWYYEVYYQFYNPDGKITDENGAAYDWVCWTFGQGGHASPDEQVSITHEIFDGEQFDWEAIDGSGMETLSVHYVFDENFGSHRLSASCGEATRTNPLKIYYRAAPHTVTYQYDGDVPAGAPDVPGVVHTSYSAPVTVATTPSMDGYTFSGWELAEESKQYENLLDGTSLTMPNADVKLVGFWTKVEEPATKYTVTFKPGDHGTLSGSVADGNVQITGIVSGTKLNASQIPAVNADSKYSFTDWLGSDGKTYSNSDILALAITANMTFTAQYKKDSGGDAHHPDPDPDPKPKPEEPEEVPEEEIPLAETPWLNTEDHYAYIIGYSEDGTVRPNANITRAEVATIFFRLLTDEARDEFCSTSNSFSDVAPDAWYNNAVSTMVNAGIIQGYEDGTFRPNNNITRAEFAAIASRFMSSGYDVEEDLFTDIANHWARQNINDAAMTKWINGYPDGTFLPDKAITRAEAVTLVNNVLQRKPDADHMLDSMIKWPDNPESAWYYEAIQEATNSHDYDLFGGAEYETWTALQENRDWAALEKDWVNAHRTGGEVM